MIPNIYISQRTYRFCDGAHDLMRVYLDLYIRKRYLTCTFDIFNVEVIPQARQQQQQQTHPCDCVTNIVDFSLFSFFLSDFLEIYILELKTFDVNRRSIYE